MNAYELLMKLRAFQQGKPLPRGETIHFPVADDDETLVLAFCRMGGESSPWGLAFGCPDKKPKILTVPEPRNRDAVADMVAGFAPVLLDHVFSPDHSSLAVESADQPRPLRQVWLPNRTHLDMLHFLAYAYTFTKWGTAERVKLLNALGRAAGWLFREAQRPGQVFAIVATEALRESFVFPSEDTRQGHLGYLLAWLETKGGREIRLQAAAAAERESMATNLDPVLEREALEPRVGTYNEARSSGDEAKALRSTKEIRHLLEPELQRRFALTVQARARLSTDKRRRNSGLDLLIKGANQEHWYQYVRLEHRIGAPEDGPAFIPSPETDRHPAAAASRYYVHEASAEQRAAILLHDDRQMQAEAIGRGEAFRGKILSVDDEGTGKALVPVWVVGCAGDVPLKLREGDAVCVAGLANRQGRIRKIEFAGGMTRFEIEITSLKTAPAAYPGLKAATDRALEGKRLVMVAVSHDGIPRRKSRRVWDSSGPGAWLTHLAATGPRADLPGEIGEDLPSIASALGTKP